MTTSPLEALQHQCLALIESSLKTASGVTGKVLRDDESYRRLVIDPAWELVPLPVKILGRKRLCWDAIFLALREEAFQVKGESVSLLEPDERRSDGRRSQPHQDQEKAMAKNKDDAKAEGFKRGLDGKVGSAGMMEGWTDDRAAGEARTQGYAEGKRKRSRNAAEKRVVDERTKDGK